ncbi:GAP family protein [Streptomyces albidochromogenes]|uniref:GAP family protein n=1 Tax=Streptomyces albidochromogenes TaxID=329524 RepID=A0ABW6FD67_9ACTN
MTQSDPGRRVDETAAAMLEALFTQSPVGLHLLDENLRVVRVNTATPVMRGVPPETLRGRPFSEMYGMVQDDATEALLHEVLLTGVPLTQRVVRARVGGDPPQERHFEVTALRLEGAHRSVLGVGLTAADVTERERARVRNGVLGSVRRSVGRTLDPAVTGEELVEALVPEFADIAVVEVVDAVIRGDDPPVAPLPPGTPLMRTAFRSGRTGPPPAYPVGGVRRLPAPTPFTQALADLRPRVVPLNPAASWLSLDSPGTEAVRSSGAHSLLVVPLALRDAPLGIVSLYRTNDSWAFEDADLELAVELAAHTALCVDNARRYTREHTVAATVQRQLLPRRPESHTSLEAAYLSVTGGDPGAWYDTIALSSARTALIIGTVSGNGLNSAATMGQLRTAITLEPLPAMALILLLTADNGVRKGLAFILGWLVCLVVVIVCVLLFTDGSPPRAHTVPSTTALAVKLIIGIWLIAYGVRKRHEAHGPGKTPAWLAKLHDVSPWSAAGMGVLIQPWALVAAGASTVMQADLSRAASWLTLMLYCLLATATLLTMELYATFRPARAEARLQALFNWMTGHQDQAVVIVSLFLGFWLAGRSIYELL